MFLVALYMTFFGPVEADKNLAKKAEAPKPEKKVMVISGDIKSSKKQIKAN